LRGQIVLRKSVSLRDLHRRAKKSLFFRRLHISQERLDFFKLFKRYLMGDDYFGPWRAFVGGGEHASRLSSAGDKG
jgi:hypothetical protein